MNFRKNGGDIKIILQTAREIELKLFQEYSIKLEANHISTQFLSKSKYVKHIFRLIKIGHGHRFTFSDFSHVLESVERNRKRKKTKRYICSLFNQIMLIISRINNRSNV